MTMPETHAGELVEEVLPDLAEAIRLGPAHAEQDRLVARARSSIEAAWGLHDGWRTADGTDGVVDEPRELIEARIDAMFDTLLAAAEWLVSTGVEI